MFYQVEIPTKVFSGRNFLFYFFISKHAEVWWEEGVCVGVQCKKFIIQNWNKFAETFKCLEKKSWSWKCYWVVKLWGVEDEKFLKQFLKLICCEIAKVWYLIKHDLRRHVKNLCYSATNKAIQQQTAKLFDVVENPRTVNLSFSILSQVFPWLLPATRKHQDIPTTTSNPKEGKSHKILLKLFYAFCLVTFFFFVTLAFWKMLRWDKIDFCDNKKRKKDCRRQKQISWINSRMKERKKTNKTA